MQISTAPIHSDPTRGGHALTTPSKFSTAQRSLTASKHKLLMISTVNDFKNDPECKPVEISECKMTFQEHLHYILQKQEERTDAEAKDLLKVIRSNAFFESFLEMNENLEASALEGICKKIKYEKYPKGTVICHQGEKSNEKMYIVYSGDLNVHIKDPDVFIHQNLQQKREERRREALEEQLERQESPESPRSPENKEKNNNLNNQQVIPKSAMLKRGPGLYINDKEEKDERSSPFGKRLQNQNAKGQRNTIISLENRGSPFAPQSKKLAESPKLVLNAKISKGLKKLSMISKVVVNIEKSRKESFESNNSHSEYGLIVDTIHKGGFFGERALITNQPRGATIVTSTDCELLVITKDLFLSLKEKFDKKKNAILNFILNSIPTLDQLASRSIFEKLYYLFKEQRYEYGANIITEDTKGDYIYLLYDGECEIVKDIKIDKTLTLKYQMAQISPLLGIGRITNQKVLIYTIPKGTFFGDEAMFQKNHKYQYTVRVSSPRATVFSIHRGKFFMRFPSSAYVALKTLFQKKLESHEKRLSQVISTKFRGYNEETLDNSDSQINSSRERILSAKPGRIIINKENTKEPSKVTVIAKEPSPYYSVFRNERPGRLVADSLNFQDSDNSLKLEENDVFSPNFSRKGSQQPQQQGHTSNHQIYDPRGLKKVDSTLTRLLKMPPADSFSRDVAGEIFRPSSARIKTEGEFVGSQDSVDTPQPLSSRKAIDYPKTLKPSTAGVTWSDQLETKRSMNRTSIRLESGGSVDPEPLANNPSNFRLDIANAESEQRRKNNMKRLEIRLKGSQTVRTAKNSSDRVSLIKTAIMTKKSKFDRKHAKLQKNFKNLIQTTCSNPDELSPYDFPYSTIPRAQTRGAEPVSHYKPESARRRSPQLKNPSFLNMQLVNREVSRNTPVSTSRLRIQTVSPWGFNVGKDKDKDYFQDNSNYPSIKEMKEFIIRTERSFTDEKPGGGLTKTLTKISNYSSSAGVRSYSKPSK